MHVCWTSIKSWRWNNFGAWRGQSIHPAGECVVGYIPVQSALDEKKKKKRKKKKRKKLFVYSSLRNVFRSTQPINSRFLTIFVTFSKFNLSRTCTTKFSENTYAWYSVSCKEYKLKRKMITFIHVIMLYSPLGSIEIGSKFSHDPLRNIQFFISFQSQTGESKKTSRRRIIICAWIVKGAL